VFERRPLDTPGYGDEIIIDQQRSDRDMVIQLEGEKVLDALNLNI